MPKVSELKIELIDTLTPKTCSKLAINLIKYILYQAEQIPLNYESLIRVFKQTKDYFEAVQGGNDCSRSYKQIKALRFYKTIESLVTNCENTFSSLESEFVEAEGIQEILVVIGATKVLPQKMFRIVIPTLSVLENDKDVSATRNLQSLCKHVVTSEELHNFMRDKTNPTNIFIVLKVYPNFKPKTNWFFPNEDFRISNVGKQMAIFLQQPKQEVIPCLKVKESTEINGIKHLNLNSCESDKESNSESSFEWYQSKECLKGFKGFLENGASMFTLLLNAKDGS